MVSMIYSNDLEYTRTKGLTLDRKKELDLTLNADSHFARDGSDGSSVKATVVMNVGTVISWFSKTQQNVMICSMGTEYVAMKASGKPFSFNYLSTFWCLM